MAFEVKKGSFAAKTSTGTQAITGVGFQPKAVILFWERQTSTGFNAGNISGGMGMFTGATDCAVTAWGINDAAAANGATGSYGYYNKGTYCCLMMSNATPTYARYASPVSLDVDGFTLTWAAADANASIVHYVALGGSTLTNAKVAEATFKTSTGNKAVTGVGFQPDCLLFMGRRDGGTPLADVSIGAAISSSQRAQVSFGVLRGSSPSVVYQSQTTDRCLQIPQSDAAVADSIDLVSMDADGFTFNQTVAFGVAAPFAYLALKGGSYKIGTETQKTSAGSKSTTGVGFAPAGLLLFGANHTSTATGQNDKRRISIGAASAPGTEGAIWDQAVDNVATTQTATASVTDKILRHATADSTVDAEADLASYNSDGFTLDWTTADATAREFIYLAFGPGTVSGFTDPVTLTVGVGLAIAEEFSNGTTFTDPVSLPVGHDLAWWPHATDAIIDAGASGKWDDHLVYNPRVCRNLDGTLHRDPDGYAWMAYTASGSTAGVDRDRVGMFRITDFDDPGTWERLSVDDPVLGWGTAGVYDASGSVWDGTDVAVASFLYDDTTSEYVFFYEGNATSNEATDTVQIGIATTTLTPASGWTKYADNPILERGTGSGDKDTGDLYAPIVIYDSAAVPAERWRMWFVGHINGSTYGIMAATAPTRTSTWTKHLPTSSYVFKPTANIGFSQAWKDTDGSILAVYDNYDNVQTVRLARSPDGITGWEDLGELFRIPASGWDAGGVYWTDHFDDAGTWRMVYTGRNPAATVYGIGAVSWTGDRYRLTDQLTTGFVESPALTVAHVLSVTDVLDFVAETPALTVGHALAVTDSLTGTAASDLEGVVLDGLDLNTHGLLGLEELSFGASSKRPELIGNADSDGEALLRDPKQGNRQATMKLKVRADSRDEANAAIDELVQKLEECEVTEGGLPLVWTPVDSTESFTLYVLSGEVTEIPITHESAYFAGWPTVIVQLTCRPALYGTPVTYGPVAASTPLVELELADVPGQLPAEASLTVTDAAGHARRHVTWGLEQRFYNPASPADLLLTSDDLAVTGYGGSRTTRTGAYDPDATGTSVIHGALIEAWSAICAAEAQPHVGTFRVIVRCYVDTADVRVRLAWRTGDGPFFTNPVATPPVAGMVELDLGIVTVPEADLGSQRWTGRVEGCSLSNSGILQVNYLQFIPAAEGFGWARSVPTSDTGTVVAYDNFNGADDWINGRSPTVGANWVAAAGAASGFRTGNLDSGEVLLRAAALDLDAKIATFGSAMTDMEVLSGIERPDNDAVQQGVVARYIDADNFVRAWYGANRLVITKSVAGVLTNLAVSNSVSLPTGLNDLWFLVRANGEVAASLRRPNGSTLIAVTASSSILATGGALAAGKPGVVDAYLGSAPAPTRYWHYVTAMIPPAELVVTHPSRSVVFRHDRVLRQDAAGGVYGAPPSYRGAPFLVPVAGDHDRTSRVVVAARRADIETSTVDDVTDATTVAATVTPRYLWPA